MRVEDIIVDCLTFPIATGQEETRRDGAGDDRGDPRGQAALPGRADHARASPTSRSGSTRPPGWCSTRCSSRRRSRPASTPRSCTRRRSCRWRGSRTSSARSRSTWSTTAATDDYDPLQRFLELFEGVDATALRQTKAAELAALPLSERLERRIVDGERNGLEADLDEALRHPTGAGDRQRHAARRDADGRRAVRLRPDAAAVRAAVGRGDEGRGRPPRAAHGAHRRARQGHDRARDGARRRARHRQEPRRHHPDATTATPSSTSASSSRSARSSRRPTSTAPTSSGCPACS